MWPLEGETAQTQELKKSEQNTIFIPYVHTYNAILQGSTQ